MSAIRLSLAQLCAFIISIFDGQMPQTDPKILNIVFITLSTPHLLMPPLGCSYGTISHLNRAHLNPILNQLVETAYFRYFKVRTRH